MKKKNKDILLKIAMGATGVFAGQLLTRIPTLAENQQYLGIAKVAAGVGGMMQKNELIQSGAAGMAIDGAVQLIGSVLPPVSSSEANVAGLPYASHGRLHNIASPMVNGIKAA